MAASVCLFGLAGCGGLDVDLAPVEGTITMDGQPVADAGVVFTPKKEEQGPSASATTDANGHFTLITVNRPGAVLGEHFVVITKMEMPNLPRGPDGQVDESRLREVKEIKTDYYVPAKYSTPATSGLEATVHSSGNNFTFDLMSDETVTKTP
jgi:hypothetical protein